MNFREHIETFLIFVFLSVLFLAMLYFVRPAHAYMEKLPLEGNCYEMLVENRVPDQQYITKRGMILRRYDLNGNGKIDLVTNTPTIGGIEADVPLFYLRDFDEDDNPDIVYIDRQGKGLCKDFQAIEPDFKNATKDKQL